MGSIVVGSDFTTELSGVRNAATGSYLNSATVTFVLYTSAGVSVTSGTCDYVASSDGVYRGVVESTVTSTLTAGAYYVIYTVSSSGVDSLHREDLTAVAPGSVIIDVPGWSALTGTSPTSGSADELSIAGICEAVSEALTRLCYPILLAPKALTLYACDAPLDNTFFTPVRPCRSVSALYLVPGADGDSSLADADHLLTNYTDYLLDVDDALNGWSRGGRVYRRGTSCWGFEMRRPLGRLAYATDPNRKALFISGSFGPASVSPIVRQAAALAVSLLFERRKKGIPLQSESFNGYSYSNSGPFTAESAIKTPDVMELLRTAGVLPIHVG